MGPQTQIEILKFESKKNASQERDNADQLCCQSMSSLHQDKALIQSSGSLATKYRRSFQLDSHFFENQISKF